MPAIAPLASPPQSQEQLLAQARQLAGYSLGMEYLFQNNMGEGTPVN